jgi:hypothetical protein
MGDDTRKAALARNLCARLCDERKGVDVLELVDRVLCILERDGVADVQLFQRIRNDRYSEDEGSDEDHIKRLWFNRGSKHVEALIRIDQGLHELADAPALDLRVKHALTGVDE